ncbi:MAG: hypothetical protein AB8F34_12290 [Akkermansiaceae bacterium]
MVECEGRGAQVAVAVDAAAAHGGIARERGVVECEGHGALGAVTVDAAAVDLGGIARERGVVEREGRVVIVDRPAAIVWGLSRGTAVGEGEVGEGNGVTGGDLHDAGLFVGVDGDASWNVGRIDGQGFVDEELRAPEGEGVVGTAGEDGGIEGKIAGKWLGNGITEGAGAGVVVAGDE